MLRFPAEPRSSGFSLFELVVVLALLSLATGIVAMSIRTAKPSDTLRLAAHEVAASLKGARNCAVSRSLTCVWSIADRQFTVIPLSRKDGINPQSVFSARTLPAGIHFAKSDENIAEILFFARGDASGGTVILRHERGDEIRITVSRITAAVRIEGHP